MLLQIYEVTSLCAAGVTGAGGEVPVLKETPARLGVCGFGQTQMIQLGVCCVACGWWTKMKLLSTYHAPPPLGNRHLMKYLNLLTYW